MNDLTRYIEVYVGHCLPIDALQETDKPFVHLLSGPEWEDGRQVAERIAGICECPSCGVLWPMTETIDQWADAGDGLWKAEAWSMGAAMCTECGVVMVDTFDGAEAYQLPMEKKPQ